MRCRGGGGAPPCASRARAAGRARAAPVSGSRILEGLALFFLPMPSCATARRDLPPPRARPHSPSAPPGAARCRRVTGAASAAPPLRPAPGRGSRRKHATRALSHLSPPRAAPPGPRRARARRFVRGAKPSLFLLNSSSAAVLAQAPNSWPAPLRRWFYVIHSDSQRTAAEAYSRQAVCCRRAAARAQGRGRGTPCAGPARPRRRARRAPARPRAYGARVSFLRHRNAISGHQNFCRSGWGRGPRAGRWRGRLPPARRRVGAGGTGGGQAPRHGTGARGGGVWCAAMAWVRARVVVPGRGRRAPGRPGPGGVVAGWDGGGTPGGTAGGAGARGAAAAARRAFCWVFKRRGGRAAARPAARGAGGGARRVAPGAAL